MEGRIQLRSVRSMAKARHCGGFTWGRRYHVAMVGMAIRCTQKERIALRSTQKSWRICADILYIYMIYEDILTEHDSRTAGRSQIWAILWMAWRSHTYSKILLQTQVLSPKSAWLCVARWCFCQGRGGSSFTRSKTQAIQLGCDADKMPVIGESLTLLQGWGRRLQENLMSIWLYHK